MAWPFSRIATLIDHSLPAIDAALLNGIQDTIIDALTGVQLVKKLLLDGVTSDLTEVLLTSVAPASGALRHWAKIRCTSSSYLHIYSNEKGLLISFNAAYTGTGGAEWHQEDSAKGSHLLALGLGYGIHGPGVSSAFKVSGAADWAAAAWDWGETESGTFYAQTTRSSATPGSGQSVFPGRVYKDTLPIGWGVIDYDGACVKSANVKSAAWSVAGQLDVELNYGAAAHLCVVPSLRGSGHITWTETAADKFSIFTTDTTGSASSISCAFVVFGG